MQKQLLNILLLALLGIFIYAGCTSDVIEMPKPPDVKDTISFSQEIQPIFNDHCIGCHGGSGTAPNLTSGNSYNSLMSMALVDTAQPEQSEIYQRLLPGGKTHPYKNATYATTILTWIKQGAPNN